MKVCAHTKRLLFSALIAGLLPSSIEAADVQASLNRLKANPALDAATLLNDTFGSEKGPRRKAMRQFLNESSLAQLGQIDTSIIDQIQAEVSHPKLRVLPPYRDLVNSLQTHTSTTQILVNHFGSHFLVPPIRGYLSDWLFRNRVRRFITRLSFEDIGALDQSVISALLDWQKHPLSSFVLSIFGDRFERVELRKLASVIVEREITEFLAVSDRVYHSSDQDRIKAQNAFWHLIPDLITLQPLMSRSLAYKFGVAIDRFRPDEASYFELGSLLEYLIYLNETSQLDMVGKATLFSQSRLEHLGKAVARSRETSSPDRFVRTAFSKLLVSSGLNSDQAHSVLENSGFATFEDLAAIVSLFPEELRAKLDEESLGNKLSHFYADREEERDAQHKSEPGIASIKIEVRPQRESWDGKDNITAQTLTIKGEPTFLIQLPPHILAHISGSLESAVTSGKLEEIVGDGFFVIIPSLSGVARFFHDAETIPSFSEPIEIWQGLLPSKRVLKKRLEPGDLVELLNEPNPTFAAFRKYLSINGSTGPSRRTATKGCTNFLSKARQLL